ncbi:MAG TPA: cation diffusion facilitator family transporter [Chitinophagales bacterium]|nr:cation diffusion facilitator family transporter [Chitinophagales bacterium]
MKTPEENSKEVLRIQLFVVVAGALLLVAKFTAYFLTHSNTILTDALESIINVIAGFFALYSLYLSSKPKDYDHPYGHGKVEFISAGFEGILIAIAGVSIIVKSAISFFHPQQLEHLDIGLAIVLGSGLINYLLAVLLTRAGEKHQSLTLKADGEHLKSDAYSSLGVLVGIGLILLTKWAFLDSIVAIIFGFLIIYTGVKLVRKSIAGIMDETDEGIVLAVIEYLSSHRKPEWIDVHNLRVIQYGNKLHVDCHVTLPWYYTLEEAHKEIEEMALLVNDKRGNQVEFFIHEDPCVPTSCKICTLADCPVRQEAFKYKIDWNLENVVRNKKHGL